MLHIDSSIVKLGQDSWLSKCRGRGRGYGSLFTSWLNLILYSAIQESFFSPPYCKDSNRGFKFSSVDDFEITRDQSSWEAMNSLFISRATILKGVDHGATMIIFRIEGHALVKIYIVRLSSTGSHRGFNRICWMWCLNSKWSRPFWVKNIAHQAQAVPISRKKKKMAIEIKPT